MIVNEYINNQLQTLMANHTRYVYEQDTILDLLTFFFPLVKMGQQE